MNNTNRMLIMITAISGALAVMTGAFGAHAFKDELIAAGRLDTFNTAIEYHFYHTLAALLAILLLRNTLQERKAQMAGFLFLTGIILFSGSLYVLSFTDQTWVGFITPFGGIFFIAGWLLLSYAAYRDQFQES